MKISGTWEGYYEYGLGYILPYFGQRVKVILALNENDEGFSGTVTEEQSAYAVPYDAAVNGFTEGEMISFVKTYPVFPQIADDWKTISIIPGKLEIEHTGYIDSANQAMYGTWVIADDAATMGEGNFCSGTWLIRRVN